MFLAFIGCLGTALVAVPLALTQSYHELNFRVAGFGLAGGVLNGIGLAALYVLFALAPVQKWELSKIVPITYILTIVLITLAGRIFFAEQITTVKAIGMALTLVGLIFIM